ncbi:hypothetical protein NHX12_013482 [Muraenolepis orangiensis]|uniref:Uncharacterized protein n=1 Tax=Muraenolepis orangiensis TaxID=630683 RepID=A0A9Q0DF11_9TELE|nr:hypothetical protein NHX12_013482 [Muraenolepis orangiensis]
MPERLASKSCTKPDSITSSVRGNFSAHAMVVTTLNAHTARCPFNSHRQVSTCMHKETDKHLVEKVKMNT